MIKSNEEVQVQKPRLWDKQKKIPEKAWYYPNNCICVLRNIISS